jgi:pimeloyl-ACP methyl ester carboxylesterase
MAYVTVPTAEGSLATLDQGEGDPILLLPGHTMSAKRWDEAGYVARLAEHRRVIAVDPLGHGESAHCADPDAYAWDKILQRMFTVVDHFGLPTFDVWGYSRGALIGNLMAEAEPGRVRTLIYGGNVLFDAGPIMKEMGLVRTTEAIRAQHQACLGGDWEAYWATFPLPLPDEVKRNIEGRNHLPSISASGMASALDPQVFRLVNGVSTCAYWGDDEIFSDLNVACSKELGIKTATVPGNHAGAFDPAGPALDVVTAWLNLV